MFPNPYTDGPFSNNASSPSSNTTGPFPNEEPSAGFREMAVNLRQMFVALVQAGFREDQAMHAVGITIASAIQVGNQDGGE